MTFSLDVRKAAAAGKKVLQHIDRLELAARALRKAADAQFVAEAELPARPVRTFKEAGRMMINDAEIETEYVVEAPQYRRWDRQRRLGRAR